MFSLGGLIVWFVGGRDVIGQSMSLGELIAFLAYLAMFYAPLATLSNFTTWLTSFLTGAKRVLELLDTPVAVREPATPAAAGPSKGSIVFDNVHFGYDVHQPIIKGVSFEVSPGEMVGIVGRSGSGKTTLVNLLGRFYDVDEGKVLVDGIDVRDYASSDLRRRIGIVFQETYLFRGTIWDNLTYGRPEATVEQGLSAAKASRAHDFVMRSPLGYDTALGEHGAGLSGGEKQRLSLARALLYDPPILVLDEATSNIDTEAERMIQEALAHLTAGRTTIAIAHRLSTLRNADRILVFDRGQLAEEGSHEELLAADGIYARMVRIQTQLTRDASVDRISAELESEPVAVAASEAKERKSATSGRSGQTAKISASSRATATDQPITETPDDGGPTAVPEHEIMWLQPGEARFSLRELGSLRMEIDGRDPVESVFVARAFPATSMDEFLSIRTWDAEGDDQEVGMIRDLAKWPAEAQELVRASLARRYHFRWIQNIHSIDARHGHLWFDVRTNAGREQFCMRWSQSRAVDFGPHGKLIHDVEDNQYVITNVDELPTRDRELLERHVYW